MRKCGVCGSSDFYTSGKCRPCQHRRNRELQESLKPATLQEMIALHKTKPMYQKWGNV